jgi:homocysteine S-methyltransferase
MSAIPRPSGASYVTDGGLETDLIFNRGFDLAEFAAFPLLADERGRAVLVDYYAGYADVARRAAAGLVLAAPTWRSNPDWGERLGYDAHALDRVNRDAIVFLREVRDGLGDLDVVLSGVVGPRGDGYVAGERPDVEEAARYHRAQIDSFALGGAELVDAITMTTAEEGTGVALAAAAAGLPSAISFTVETDGRLPDGTWLGDAIRLVDEAAPVAYFGINCAHPQHILPALDGGDWTARVAQVRPNASTKTHAELDDADELDAGDIELLTSTMDRLRAQLPGLSVVGGCCGTDARHVGAMWGVAAP